jgi:hypothetical protein
MITCELGPSVGLQAGDAAGDTCRFTPVIAAAIAASAPCQAIVTGNVQVQGTAKSTAFLLQVVIMSWHTAHLRAAQRRLRTRSESETFDRTETLVHSCGTAGRRCAFVRASTAAMLLNADQVVGSSGIVRPDRYIGIDSDHEVSVKSHWYLCRGLVESSNRSSRRQRSARCEARHRREPRRQDSDQRVPHQQHSGQHHSANLHACATYTRSLSSRA